MLDLFIEKELEKLEKNTTTVEEFVCKSLELDFEYEDIFEYLDTRHKG